MARGSLGVHRGRATYRNHQGLPPGTDIRRLQRVDLQQRIPEARTTGPVRATDRHPAGRSCRFLRRWSESAATMVVTLSVILLPIIRHRARHATRLRVTPRRTIQPPTTRTRIIPLHQLLIIRPRHNVPRRAAVVDTLQAAEAAGIPGAVGADDTASPGFISFVVPSLRARSIRYSLGSGSFFFA